MNHLKLARPQIAHLPVYQPGKPIDYVAREFGLPLDSICKLASNENPLGPSPHAVEAACDMIGGIHSYPDGACMALREALAQKLHLAGNQLVFGNGSNDLIELFAHVFLGEGDEAVMGEYAFPVYQIVTQLVGATPVKVPMPQMTHDLDAVLAAITDKTRAVFLPSTNNPTGTSNSAEEVMHFIERLPEHVALLFDEAYAEFHNHPVDLRPCLDDRPILCTRTFSKLYGLAGLRIGYAYGSAEMMDLMNRVRQPFNVSSVAQAAALAALEDVRFIKHTRAVNAEGLEQLYKGFDELGLSYTRSDGNFVLVAVPRAQEAFDFLQKRGVIVRPIPNMGDYLRVSVGMEHQNHNALKGLQAWLNTLNT